ncbi:replication initiation protein, partial [Sphingomonas sp. NPDC019816]
VEFTPIKKGRKVERVSMMWLPKTMSGRRDAQNLIDQHSIVRRAKLRGDIPEMPVLVDFSAPAAER